MRRFSVKILAAFLSVLMSSGICAAPVPFTRTESDGEVFSWVSNDSKMIALTFDDGPHPEYTEKILDVLQKYDVRATFFVIGENAEKRPELIRKIAAGGHEIGNHTFDHKSLRKKNGDEIEEEIERTENAVFEAAGCRPTVLRPPEGKYSEKVVMAAEKLGYSVVLWSVDTKDWAHRPADAICRTVLGNVTSGDIILCHDFISGESHTAEALAAVIPKLLHEGYTFVTVSELISLWGK